MWGQLATRPDLSFAVSLLARFQANPGIAHWSALLHVIGYIKNTPDLGLTYSRDYDPSPRPASSTLILTQHSVNPPPYMGEY